MLPPIEPEHQDGNGPDHPWDRLIEQAKCSPRPRQQPFAARVRHAHADINRLFAFLWDEGGLRVRW